MKWRIAKLPPAIAAKIEACGAIKTPYGWLLETESDCYLKHFGPSPYDQVQPRRASEPLKPIPHDEWPDEMLKMEAEKIEGERGVGDTAARIGDCKHCAARTSRWNAMYPYITTATTSPPRG